MKRVIIESPYAASVDFTVEQHLSFARMCMKHSLTAGEAPIASHLLYTQPGILDDDIPYERDRGINAGFAWWEAAELICFYLDLGMSNGMQASRDRCDKLRTEYEFRYPWGGLSRDQLREMLN